MNFYRAIIGLVILTLSLAVSARATSVTYTGTDSFGRAASATFTLNSGTLTIALANTAQYDAMNPTDMLTALFFNMNGVTLSPVNAIVGPSSSVINVNTTSGGVLYGAGFNVGGEWGYGSGFNVSGSGSGTSSTGLGLFGSPNFNGGNLQGPTALDGVQYGITTATDDPKTGNGGITSAQSSQFIKNEVILTLTAVVPGGFDLAASINDVRFQYGTTLSEPSLPGSPGNTPTPDGGSTVLLLGSTLVGFGLLRRKFSRS